MSNVIKPTWSRSEKLMGGGALLILLSVVVPVLVSLEANRRQALVQQDLATIVSACERFFVEYGYWPSPHMGMAGDMRYGRETGNQLVFNILRAVDGPGNEGHRHNPNRIEYLRVGGRGHGRSGLNAGGTFMDPWGTPYQIVLDTDMNNTVTMTQTIYPNQPGLGVAIWSFGPDRLSDTDKDILSWRN